MDRLAALADEEAAIYLTGGATAVSPTSHSYWIVAW
jgi:hypothetical protein